MDINVLKRIIYRLFPELTGRWHLPHFAKVVALPELPSGGELSDEFTPFYAADLKLLDGDLKEREDIDILQAVPLPIVANGDGRGRLEPPAIGAIVEVAFAYGRPDKPFVRGVLPFGFTLPSIKHGESRYQVRDGVYQHIDADGNMITETDGKVMTKAKTIIEEADLIYLNGGTGVCTGETICPFTGSPHVDVSMTVFAGKK